MHHAWHWAGAMHDVIYHLYLFILSLSFHITESRSSLYRMDPTNLDTLEHVMYNDQVAGDLSTAHPKVQGS